MTEASAAGAGLVAFPECFVPGYRAAGKGVLPPDPAFLERAWSTLAAAWATANLVAVVGTERFVDGALRLTALVIAADGTIAGFQDKVQLDPSEEGLYVPGVGRHLFHAGPLTFGIAICHEGWRYPETVRWAARRGAQLILHPHFHEAEPGGYILGSPTTSAVARPDGTLLAYQPYGKEGLLIADIDLSTATGLLASRCKAEAYGDG
jgi:predicted amidohydrolase